MTSFSERNKVVNSSYWNEQDYQLNAKHRHTTAIHNPKVLLQYQRHYGIKVDLTDPQCVSGLHRYVMEQSGKPIAKTLQGAAYSAIDVITGRRVVIKCSVKQLVKSHVCRDGTRIAEDLRQEAQIMHHVATHNPRYTDSYSCKLVDFFESEHHYYLVAEHGGECMFDFVVKNHPHDQKESEAVAAWTHNIRYYFRMVARAVYYLHTYCNVAHMDISLENTVIDTKANAVRIIDFGLAKCFQGDNWEYDNYRGKEPYHSPEMRKIKVFRETRVTIDSSLKFDARGADVWALGVLLLTSLIGAQPWHVAEPGDKCFYLMVTGKMEEILIAWKRNKFVDDVALDLLGKIFRPPKERISIKDVLDHPYVKLGARKVYQSVHADKK